ncbi:hypothetical protein Smp_130700 [Schistosoma mansoni]|uniref:hypothetical protein n=1 Tax=Schistosoma mansoni TaxID=6183 RepID=UPI0001A64467|nr:hypothetical protein Smp_130700 [Schistosoma mansoni]|eukprot:XP_018654440.1 hypothetical protein Smp_130700 [Schistosoma mansoni]
MRSTYSNGRYSATTLALRSSSELIEFPLWWIREHPPSNLRSLKDNGESQADNLCFMATKHVQQQQQNGKTTAYTLT